MKEDSVTVTIIAGLDGRHPDICWTYSDVTAGIAEVGTIYELTPAQSAALAQKWQLRLDAEVHGVDYIEIINAWPETEEIEE